MLSKLHISNLKLRGQDRRLSHCHKPYLRVHKAGNRIWVRRRRKEEGSNVTPSQDSTSSILPWLKDYLVTRTSISAISMRASPVRERDIRRPCVPTPTMRELVPYVFHDTTV